jgi:hypothetical protein
MVYYVRGSEGEKGRGGEDLMSGEYGIEICSLINAEHPTGKIKFLWNKPKEL